MYTVYKLNTTHSLIDHEVSEPLNGFKLNYDHYKETGFKKFSLDGDPDP